jgi:hypothetical protein
MNPDYKRAYETVQREMAEIDEQRQLLERRYARLKQTSFSLETLMESESDLSLPAALSLPVIGLTDACRHALTVSKSPRTAQEVRDWLVGSGYDLSEQENALASIHTILKRLVTSGQAEAGTTSDGKVSYKWNGPKWYAYIKDQTRRQKRLADKAALHEANGEAEEARQAEQAIEDIERRKRIQKLESGKK